MKNFLFILFFSVAALSTAKPTDSLTVKVINGKRFIVHKVDLNQTAIAIATKYNISITDIQKYNPHINLKKLKNGILLYILTNDSVIESNNNIINKVKEGSETHANANANEKNNIIGKHVVQYGETLNSLAQIYNVNISDIIRWNNIRNFRIDVGQVLIVNEAASILPYKPWNRRNEEIPNADVKIINDCITEEYANMQLVEGNSISFYRNTRGEFIEILFTEDSISKIIELNDTNLNQTLNPKSIFIGEEIIKEWGIKHLDQLIIIRYID